MDGYEITSSPRERRKIKKRRKIEGNWRELKGIERNEYRGMGSTNGKVWREWIPGDGEYKKEGLKGMNTGRWGFQREGLKAIHTGGWGVQKGRFEGNENRVMGSTKRKVWRQWIPGDGEYKREGLKGMNNGGWVVQKGRF